METALEKLNPTLFNEFAGKNNEIWNEIVGTHIQHSIWGLCTIEGVDLDEFGFLVSGRTVALRYFREGIFSDLTVPAVIAVEVREFEKKKNEMESEKRQEEVVAERREAEKRRILAEDQLRAQTIGQEKRRLESDASRKAQR